MSTKHFYFAYGMNTDTEAMALRTGTPLAIGRGMVRDHAFRFAIHADVFPKPGTNTFGVLWELDDDQLASLDKREGYPYYYNRKKVTVEAGGQSYEAWMYFMTPGHVSQPPYQSYYDMLSRGYTTFDVPLSQIEDALEQSHGYGAKDYGRPTRWFDSYEQLLKEHSGKKRLQQIQREANHQGLTLEQLCEDYVEYGIITVPNHFQVRDSEYSKI
jgi:gamma-glutamylcyclotransferase (GGCT)/AIG2-like uncharacterized protein YtfP